MADYRIFTNQDIINCREYSGSKNPPFIAFNWNNFYNNDYHVTSGMEDWGMKTVDKTDYQNNPTKLILRRHICIVQIDGNGNYPNV